MSAFSAAANALYSDANLAADAIYTPTVGDAVTVRAIVTAPDDAVTFGGPLVSATLVVSVRVSEIASPVAGDVIEVNGESRVVQGVPRRDVERLSWLMDTAPQS